MKGKPMVAELQEVPQPEKQDVLDTTVPHLVAEKMLQWQQAHFDAMKAIYDKLDELVTVMKEVRDGVPGSTD